MTIEHSRSSRIAPIGGGAIDGFVFRALLGDEPPVKVG